MGEFIHMPKRKDAYAEAGVNIDAGNRFVELIKPMVKATSRPEVLADIGGFGGLFSLRSNNYKNPVLVSSTDGVGTKLKIAFLMNKHDTVGIDLVAMSVNDILTSGATPLFFLDYFATGKLSTKTAGDVIKGIANGCSQAACSLIGGETAEMPGFYGKGEYDLAGFAVGIVEKAKIIDGKSIKDGDAVIGISSSGLHSNGYSLVRKVFVDLKRMSVKKFIPELGCLLGDELLRPTRIYVKAFNALKRHVEIKGMAHITGGGIDGNLPRIFQKGIGAVIRKGSWPVHPLFGLIRKSGNVPDKDMKKTFNMGIGYIIIIDEKKKR